MTVIDDVGNITHNIPYFQAPFLSSNKASSYDTMKYIRLKLNALQPLLKILDPPALFEILYGLCLYLFFTKQSKFWSHHTDLANKSRIRLFVRRLPSFKKNILYYFLYPFYNFRCQILRGRGFKSCTAPTLNF